jgi:squalene synthase HpnC
MTLKDGLPMPAKPLDLLNELRHWCPGVVEAAEQAEPAPLKLLDAERYCRGLATSHYENFSLFGFLLPRALRQPFFNVYAYCRWSDDLGDELGDRELSIRLLGWWRGELARCWAGDEMRHPVFVALQRTAREFALSREPFDNLLSAFEQDQRITEYRTFDELLDYCRNSANPVGRIVLRLCRCDDERSVELSDAVCTGLQLANFWQDVARDADIGRTYLPREDCERFGYSRQDLAGRVTNEVFVNLLRFEVDRARERLLAVRELAPRLRGRLQVAIELFGEGGLKTCDRIESLGFRVWERRPVVTRWDAASLLLKCLGRTARRRFFGPRVERPLSPLPTCVPPCSQQRKVAE